MSIRVEVEITNQAGNRSVRVVKLRESFTRVQSLQAAIHAKLLEAAVISAGATIDDLQYKDTKSPQDFICLTDEDLEHEEITVVRCGCFCLGVAEVVVPPTPPTPQVTYTFDIYSHLRKPLIVPAAPAIYDSLRNVKFDLFTVTPVEIQRKAIDELGFGLHWFILYTMVHSSAYAANEKSVIRFTTKSSFPLSAEGELTQINDETQMVINTGSIKLLIDSMMAYDRSDYAGVSPAWDIRQLLRHVEKVNKAYVQSKYYSPDVTNLAGTARDCALFSIHRCAVYDQLVADEPTFDCPQDIATRDLQCVCKSIDILEALVGCFKVVETFSSDRPRITYVDNACKQLREAANKHFKSVAKICNLFHRLYPVSIATVDDTVIRTKLMQIQDEISRDSMCASGNTSDISQFALVALWARFGGLQWHGNDIEDDLIVSFSSGVKLTLSNTERNASKHLSCVEVRRYRLTKPNIHRQVHANYIFVEEVETSGWIADPIGITNWDITNRAVDLCHLALRECLQKAARCIDNAINTGAQFSMTTSLTILMEALQNHEEKPLILDQSSKLPNKVLMEKNGGQVRENLFVAFLHEYGDSPRRFERFVRYDPHWTDPRRVCEFLMKIKEGQKALFPMARRATQIRDKCAHHLNLLNPTLNNKLKFEEDFCALIDLVEGFQAKLCIDGDNCRYYTALKELRQSLPHYQRWRMRKMTGQKYDRGTQLKKASVVVSGILKALEANNGSVPANPPGDIESGSTDGTFFAIKRLLQLIVLTPQVKVPSSAKAHTALSCLMFDDDSEDESVV